MPDLLFHSHRRILVIDDNRAIHDDFRKILVRAETDESRLEQLEAGLFGASKSPPRPIGFEMDSAYQGKDGLEAVQRANADDCPYSMAFIDVRMPPGWDGIETTSKIWEVDPDLQVVICTAYSDYSWEDILAQVGQSDRLVILKKPFDNVEVLQLANALTEKWRLLHRARLRMEDLEQMVNRRTDELLRSEEKFRLLTESSLAGVYLIQDNRFVYVNEALATALGYAPTEIIGRLGPLDLTHPDDQPLAAESIRRRIAGEVEAVHYEFRGRRKDGSIIHAEVHGRSISYYGKPAVLGMMLDITDRKRTEEQLRKLSRAVEQSPTSVMITDRDGRIEYVNPRFVELTGYTPDEARGQTPRMLKSGETPPEVYAELWRTILAGGDWRGEFHNRRKDGSLFWEAAVISGVKDEGGRVTHFLAVKEDITERKAAEQQRREMQSQLQQAQKLEAIGQLAAGTAHEINTPMQCLGGNIQFLKTGFARLHQLGLLYEQLRRTVQAGMAPDATLRALAAELEKNPIDYFDDEIPNAIQESLQSVDRVARVVHAIKEFLVA